MQFYMVNCMFLNSILVNIILVVSCYFNINRRMIFRSLVDLNSEKFGRPT